MKDIDLFLRDLRRLKHTDTVYNPYRHLKLTNNLRHYLNYMTNHEGSRILLVGEALGHKGGKLTGIPFSSGYVIQNYEHPLFNSIRDELILSNIESENTAMIVWDYLLTKETLPLFWNAFPYHPHPKDNPMQNRAPNQQELTLGSLYLRQIVQLFKPNTIAGIGNKGYNCIHNIFPEHNISKIRHPSFGGKKEFIQGMDKIIND